MHPDKSPGPNGFNSKFFQTNWELIKADVTEAVLSFFSAGKILIQFNHKFLTLIPKSHEAQLSFRF